MLFWQILYVFCFILYAKKHDYFSIINLLGTISKTHVNELFFKPFGALFFNVLECKIF